MKLKDVKKYFKNAKEVKCLYNGDVIDITQNIETPIHKFDEKFWISISNHIGISVQLTDGKKFAEIISYKDTYTVSKDFILEAHKDACSTRKTEIENQFPELFPKVELEIGKWLKDDTNPKWLMYNDGNNIYGFDTGGNWFYRSNESYELQSQDRLATKEEVEIALIAEAKKRGFKDGVLVKSFVHNKNLMIQDSETKTAYVYDYDKLHFGFDGYRCVVVYEKGKWAEIISEPKV